MSIGDNALMAKQTEEIRRFILETVRDHPDNVIELTCQQFSLTRQGASWHVRELINQQQIVAQGSTRNRRYNLAEPVLFNRQYVVDSTLEEDAVWTNDLAPLFIDYPENIIQICQHGVTEMVNNVIDHSESEVLEVWLRHDPVCLSISINDCGVGIFKKIKNALGFKDDRRALLELAKGKFTTDRTKHTGEGIFFTSRMFDEFGIRSGLSFFNHRFPDDDWMIDVTGNDFDRFVGGTNIHMLISPFSHRTAQEVFDRYAGPDEYTFSSTRVPVRLARLGNENLVSRSQAKRVLARFDQFKEVMLDFNGVDTIGQAFADEIFRVFVNAHPDIKLLVKDISPQVEQMIRRAQSGLNEDIARVFESKTTK